MEINMKNKKEKELGAEMLIKIFSGLKTQNEDK